MAFIKTINLRRNANDRLTDSRLCNTRFRFHYRKYFERLLSFKYCCFTIVCKICVWVVFLLLFLHWRKMHRCAQSIQQFPVSWVLQFNYNYYSVKIAVNLFTSNSIFIQLTDKQKQNKKRIAHRLSEKNSLAKRLFIFRLWWIIHSRMRWKIITQLSRCGYIILFALEVIAFWIRLRRKHTIKYCSDCKLILGARKINCIAFDYDKQQG